MTIPPWLDFSPMTFLQALDRGSQIGLERSRLAAEAAAASAPRFAGGGGGVFDPLEQARTAAINQEIAQKADEEKKKNAAYDERRRLVSIGVPESEASAQSGWDRFSKGASTSPWQTLNLGQGEVVQVDRKTGNVKTLLAERDKPDPVKVEKLKSLRRELAGLDRLLMNPITAATSGEQIRSEKASKQGEISDLEAELGLTAAPSGASTNSATPWNTGVFTAPGATNSGGFKIISVE